jgi:hypothetical protein
VSQAACWLAQVYPADRLNLHTIFIVSARHLHPADRNCM